MLCLVLLFVEVCFETYNCSHLPPLFINLHFISCCHLFSFLPGVRERWPGPLRGDRGQTAPGLEPAKSPQMLWNDSLATFKYHGDVIRTPALSICPGSHITSRQTRRWPMLGFERCGGREAFRIHSRFSCSLKRQQIRTWYCKTHTLVILEQLVYVQSRQNSISVLLLRSLSLSPS